jgi:hypothetical protein
MISLKPKTSWSNGFGKGLKMDKPFFREHCVLVEVCYAWPDGPGKSGGGHEPVVQYRGEVNPLYCAEMTDAEVEGTLLSLGNFLGEQLGQVRVYLTYRDETFILQKESKVTPMGE